MNNDVNISTELEDTDLKMQRMRYRVYAVVLLLLTGAVIYFLGIVLNVCSTCRYCCMDHHHCLLS